MIVVSGQTLGSIVLGLLWRGVFAAIALIIPNANAMPLWATLYLVAVIETFDNTEQLIVRLLQQQYIFLRSGEQLLMRELWHICFGLIILVCRWRGV